MRIVQGFDVYVVRYRDGSHREMEQEGKIMAKFVRFCTQVYGVYHGDKGWEYYPAKPNGLVYINPDMVKYVGQTSNSEVTYVYFNPGEGDDSVFLHQPLESVVAALEEVK